jgi:diguanylate cyclase (GGDEF)-like protein
MLPPSSRPRSTHCPRRFGLLGLALLLWSWLWAAPAWALDPFVPIHRYAHAHWDRDTDLPSTSIQALLQTDDGYLWLGSQDGLVRFDGKDFEPFDSVSTPAIGNNHVQSLVQTRDGALWFTTLGGGIVRFHHDEFEAFTSAHGLPSDVARELLEDRDGALWVGTDEGLARLDGRRFESWDLREALGDAVINTLFQDRQGRLWVGARNGGVCVFADGACQDPPLPEGAEIRNPRAFLEASDGSLWIGTEGEGLFHIEGDSFTRITAEEGLVCVEVIALLEDRDGNLWIGTRRNGLARIGPGGREVFGTADGLSFPHVTSLLEDQEGNLWIGTYAGGLNSLREAAFVSYGPSDGIRTEVVLSVLEDRLGYLWVGTMQGLFRMHGEQVVPFAGMEYVDQIAPMAMLQDEDDTLWVGTFGMGLYRFRDGEWSWWNTGDGLPAEYVYALARDAQGRLWVGTQKGLARFEDGRFVVPQIDPELAHVTVRMLFLDSEDRFWVGFDGAGLHRWEDERLHPVMQAEDYTPNQLQLLTAHQSTDGTLWFGTEGGLLRYRDEQLRVITGRQGLHDERVWKVLEDDVGNLWCSSNRGVYRVEKSEIEAFFRGQRNAVISQIFGTADGMASAECNGGFNSAGAKTRDGRLWFPTTKGLAVVDPEEALRSRPIPPVSIRGVQADNREVDRHQAVRLAPGTRRVDFLFAAPYFVAPDKVTYRYRLDDEPWSPARADRFATYTNLGPGEHLFHVIASNGYGAWNEVGATVPFTVEPYFYQTTWFALLVGFSVLFLLSGGYWVRERQHRSRERELEQLVEARTAQLERFAEERRELSLRDSLTNLRNRRFLQESIRPLVEAISRQHANPRRAGCDERKSNLADRLSLAIVDIDHFKTVNDNYGHDAGDAVLQQFSELLIDTARGQDVVTRWGGEEFLVVLLGADEEGLSAFGERFRRRVAAREFTLPGGGSLRKTCSVGLVCCPFYASGELGLDLEQLVNVADLGLYHAKRSGRDRCVMVRPGLRAPASRDEAVKAFSSLEAATEGGFVVLEQITEEG